MTPGAARMVLVLVALCLASFFLPGWLALLLLAGWFAWDGAVTLSAVADKRIAQVSGSALVTWRVPWTPGLVLSYVLGVAELVAALGLVVKVLLW